MLFANLVMFCFLAVVQTLRISLTVVEQGDNLSLTCTVSGVEVGLFYWFKLNFK